MRDNIYMLYPVNLSAMLNVELTPNPLSETPLSLI